MTIPARSSHLPTVPRGHRGAFPQKSPAAGSSGSPTGTACSSPLVGTCTLPLTASHGRSRIRSFPPGAMPSRTGANTFVAVGREGRIIQSSPLGKNLSVSKVGDRFGLGSEQSLRNRLRLGCTAMFTGNDIITLTAAARPASDFLGWSGACTGTGPCTVVLSENLTLPPSSWRGPPSLPLPRRSGSPASRRGAPPPQK